MKMKFSNKIVILSIVAIVGFTIGAFLVQLKTGNELSATLIGAWFAFWSTEIIALTTIKNNKTKKQVDDIYEYVPDNDTEIIDDINEIDDEEMIEDEMEIE